jgi:hypothetical protein
MEFEQQTILKHLQFKGIKLPETLIQLKEM